MSGNLLMDFEEEDTAVHRNLKFKFDLAAPIYSEDKRTIGNQNDIELSIGWEFSFKTGFLLPRYEHLW